MSDRIEENFDVLEWLLSGRPVPLEVSGVHYSLRQPSPMEVDKIRFEWDRAFAWAYGNAMMDGLDLAPVSEDRQAIKTVLLTALEEQYQASDDDGDRRNILNEIEDTKQGGPHNRAEELASEYARRRVAHWMVDHLLATEDGETLTRKQRREFIHATLPDALNNGAVSVAVSRVFQLINYVPNS